MQGSPEHSELDVVQLPSPTVWPLVMAFGVALLCTGLVTNLFIGLLGLLFAISGGVGWFFQVFPHESHVGVPVVVQEIQIVSSRTLSERLPVDDMHRKMLPIESFRLSTGIKGGIAGGLAMIVPATLFSLLRYHSIWYAMNLLAAGGFVSWASASNVFLSQFHLQGLLAALLIHAVTSLLVGLLYGAMLPMFPRYPIVSAGLVAPLLFTGILYSALSIVSPILNQRIEWFWFVASQIAYGLVCGYVVNLHARVRSAQFRALPFSIRAGIHGDGAAMAHPSADDAKKEDRPA